ADDDVPRRRALRLGGADTEQSRAALRALRRVHVGHTRHRHPRFRGVADAAPGDAAVLHDVPAVDLSLWAPVSDRGDAAGRAVHREHHPPDVLPAHRPGHRAQRHRRRVPLAQRAPARGVRRGGVQLVHPPLPQAVRLGSMKGSLALLLLLGLAPTATAAPIARREVLPNGVVLLVAERPAVPIVAVRVLLEAGAVYDPSDRAGLANLTGALLTRGTAKRTGPALDSAIEFVGGSLEAGAGKDSVSASLGVLRKDLGLGLDLLAEVIQSPTFPPEEVTRKIGTRRRSRGT